MLCRWAGGLDDKYFARLTKGAIKIYETPDMTQLDKKDLKLEGVQVGEEGGGGRLNPSDSQPISQSGYQLLMKHQTHVPGRDQRLKGSPFMMQPCRLHVACLSHGKKSDRQETSERQGCILKGFRHLAGVQHVGHASLFK